MSTTLRRSLADIYYCVYQLLLVLLTGYTRQPYFFIYFILTQMILRTALKARNFTTSKNVIAKSDVTTRASFVSFVPRQHLKVE